MQVATLDMLICTFRSHYASLVETNGLHAMNTIVRPQYRQLSYKLTDILSKTNK